MSLFVYFMLLILMFSSVFEMDKVETEGVSSWGVVDDTLFVTEDGIHIVEKGDGFHTIILSEQEVEKIRLAANSYVPAAPGDNSIAFGVQTMSVEQYEIKYGKKPEAKVVR